MLTLELGLWWEFTEPSLLPQRHRRLKPQPAQDSHICTAGPPAAPLNPSVFCFVHSHLKTES